MTKAICFHCGLPLVWLRLDGTRDPIACEQRPSPLNGTIALLTQGRGSRLPHLEVLSARDAGQDLYAPHFCPGNRRPRKRSPEPFQLRLEAGHEPTQGGSNVPTR